MEISGSATATTAQAVVGGDVANGSSFAGRAGNAALSIGGPEQFGGVATGSNPYDLLSASLAACTAMTVRLHARHKGYPLAHVEVAVSYSHLGNSGRGSFFRGIELKGDLDETQRAELLRGAINCPVAKTLSAGSDIDTKLAAQLEGTSMKPASDYFDDLFSVINIDPD